MTSQFNFVSKTDTTFKHVEELINQLFVEIESNRHSIDKSYIVKPLVKPLSPAVDYSCTQCKTQDAISWSQCKHRYCDNCISQIISEQLRLRNEIPKCPICSSVLNVNKRNCATKCLYPIRYKIKITFKEYIQMEKLIHGFIRSKYHIIPNELIFLVFDFYHLNYVKPTKCIHNISLTEADSSYPPFIEHMSLSEAAKLNVNDQIDHRDIVGRFVAATIIEKRGTNLKIHYNGWRRKYNVWSDITAELYRFAQHESISKRPAHRLLSLKKGSYIDINPRRRNYGWQYTEIRRFDKHSGQIEVTYVSNNKHYFYWVHLDNNSEVAPFTTMCRNNYIPKDCDKCSLVLDFNKLCHKQKVCIKCNEFHPLDSIIYWSKCKHVLCINCLMAYASDELMQHTIPICPVVDCHNVIAQTEYEVTAHNITFLYNSWRNNVKYIQYVSDLSKRLKLLLYRKDRFECALCNKWHKNSHMFTYKNKNCQHQYGDTCFNYLMPQNECGHFDCPLCLAQCEVCQRFDENKYLIAWTKCGHKYHKLCAKKYIKEWLSTKPSVLGIFSSEFVSMNYMIPLCIGTNCDKFLNVNGAKLFGANKYQCDVLHELRKNSILIDSKSMDISNTILRSVTCRDGPVNKEALIRQDFTMITPFIWIFHDHASE